MRLCAFMHDLSRGISKLISKFYVLNSGVYYGHHYSPRNKMLTDKIIYPGESHDSYQIIGAYS